MNTLHETKILKRSLIAPAGINKLNHLPGYPKNCKQTQSFEDKNNVSVWFVGFMGLFGRRCL